MSLNLHHNIDRFRDGFVHELFRNSHVRLHREIGQPAQRSFPRVRVNRAQRSGMARVENLQEIEGFPAPNLAKNDPVRCEPQRVFHQIANRNFLAAFRRRLRFEPDYVRRSILISLTSSITIMCCSCGMQWFRCEVGKGVLVG